LRSNRLRFFTQSLAKILIWVAALSTIAVMILILFQILAEGLPVLRLSFFLESPKSMIDGRPERWPSPCCSTHGGKKEV